MTTHVKRKVQKKKSEQTLSLHLNLIFNIDSSQQSNTKTANPGKGRQSHFQSYTVRVKCPVLNEKPQGTQRKRESLAHLKQEKDKSRETTTERCNGRYIR